MTEAEKQANRILYLRWLATEHQQVYKDAVLPAVANHLRANLKGLDTEIVEPWQKTGQNSVGALDFSLPTSFDALTSSSSYDFGSGSDYSGGGLSTYANPDSTSSGFSFGSVLSSIGNAAGSLFNGIVKAAPVLGQTYVSTQSQLSLLQINSQRAAQGLPPLSNQNGTLVTASQLAIPNANTAAMEGALTAGGMSTTTLLLFGGIALLGLVLLSKHK